MYWPLTSLPADQTPSKRLPSGKTSFPTPSNMPSLKSPSYTSPDGNEYLP